MIDTITQHKANDSSVSQLSLNIAQKAKSASRILARASTHVKNDVLLDMSRALISESGFILEQNKEDVDEALSKGTSKAFVDRLTLNDTRIRKMAEGLREIAALPDPVGEITRMWKRPNGLLVGKMRIPIGVIGIIYESRPNVTADASGLCIKAGNSVVLRGGSDSLRSNLAIGDILRGSLKKYTLQEDIIQIVPIGDRAVIYEILKLEDYIDLIIPRGGEGLIRFVSENSRIPVLKHYKGVCHIFVDENADLEMAENICMNAKIQRPGVCNAMETLLVHRKIADRFLPVITNLYLEQGVEIRGCEKTKQIVPRVIGASEEDWYREYLDLIINIKVVRDIDDAISHIEKYGSNHTEAIITRDYKNSQVFLNCVNSSTVMVNASTRFSDGYELGLGAEIGISTSKLHAFGPMGIEELTIEKFIIYGDGQIRS